MGHTKARLRVIGINSCAGAGSRKKVMGGLRGRDIKAQAYKLFETIAATNGACMRSPSDV